jgi:hypothetical protein
MEMRRFLFILASKGLSAPVDNPTLLNLSRAMLLLQGEKCHAVYVALNHLKREEISAASKCVMDIFNKEMADVLMSKVFVSDREGLYPQEFVKYMSNFPFEQICLQVLAIPHSREAIFQELDRARTAARDENKHVPLFFTPGSQIL